MSTALDKLDWAKGDGLLPAVIQNATTRDVLMLGYMNREALEHTQRTGQITFYSRSKQRLWTKGETSGHFLQLVSIEADCDNDTLLVRASPQGPVCHTGTDTCFGDVPIRGDFRFLSQLEQVMTERIAQKPDGSYSAKLWAAGTKRIAQKVGEEGVEVALAATAGDTKELVSETADLMFHLLLLLRKRELSLQDVVNELERRHTKSR
jgi:phosphoribosyl-AMP cyclohydrolase / phosphoribosyl-ATP pyrophosphohydrolase